MAMEKTNYKTYRFMINLHLSHVVPIFFSPYLPRFSHDFPLNSLPMPEAATKDSSRKRNAVKDGRGIFFPKKAMGFSSWKNYHHGGITMITMKKYGTC